MSLFSRLTALFGAKPRLTYGSSGPALRADERHEFMIAASFDSQHAAELCVLSLAHLNMSADVNGANGHWSASFTIIMKADPAAVRKLKRTVDEAVQRQGGQVVIFTAGAPSDA